jgi:hypothetical protein
VSLPNRTGQNPPGGKGRGRGLRSWTPDGPRTRSRVRRFPSVGHLLLGCMVLGTPVAGGALASTPAPLDLALAGSPGLSPHALQAPVFGAPDLRTPPVDTAGPVLAGRVLAGGFRGGEGLPGAMVELRQPGVHRTALTDAQGRYTLSGLTAGPARVRVFHIAARPADVDLTLPARGTFHLEVELERRVISLAPVTVESPGLLERSPRPTAPLLQGGVSSARLVEAALVATSGMVESGLAHAPGLAPGLEPGDPGDAGGVLYMRGSTVDSRQVLLDGAPILTPFHLAGLLPSFDLGVLGDARFHAGGSTARHDGGLAHILELETREPGGEVSVVEVSLDPVAGRLGVELPLAPGVSFLGAIRGLHGLAGAGRGEEATLPYLYRDALLRLGIRPGQGHAFQLTAFRNREGVFLGELGRATHPRPGQTFDSPAGVVAEAGEGWYHDRAAWGNEALSARWRWQRPMPPMAGQDRPGLRVEGGMAASRYEAALPVPWIDPLQARTSSGVVRGELVVTHLGQGQRTFRWGGSVEHRSFGWELLALTSTPGTAVQAGEVHARSTRGGVFGEVARELLPGLHLELGVRADLFGADGSFRTAPRVALRQEVGEAAHLTLSVGRFHEVVPHSALNSEGTSPEDAAVFWQPALGVASATHGILTLDQALSEDFRMEVSGFVKQFEGTSSPRSTGASPTVHSSGTELRVGRGGERFDGWVGYALTWVWSSGFTEFAGRHLLSTGGRFRLPRGAELGFAMGYGAGLPLTGVGLPMSQSDAGPEPDRQSDVPRFRQGGELERLLGASVTNPLEVGSGDAFLRLDLDLSWGLTPTVGGRDTFLRPYLRVLNALDRRDAHFHYFDRWRGEELRPLASRPFLPLAGVEWRF